ncbi:hypothetical protein BH09PSE2_BH09PSE2_20150 [soil metagenome]
MGQSIPRMSAHEMVSAGLRDEDIRFATGLSLLEILAIRAERAACTETLRRVMPHDNADRAFNQ